MQHTILQLPEATLRDTQVHQIWEELVGPWYGLVLHWSRGACRNEHLGEDLAQDAFMAAWNAYKEGRLVLQPAAMNRWFFTVIHRGARRMRTRRARYVPYNPVFHDPVDWHREERAQRNERITRHAERAESAVKAIPGTDQVILHGYLAKVPTTVIAKATGLTSAAVRKRRNRRLIKIRAALEEAKQLLPAG